MSRYSITPVDFSDFHHHFHARVDYQATDDLVALRMSRGQDLPRWLHEHYHNYFGGPKAPLDRQAAFRSCLLACAGVVPHRIIDFSGGKGPFVRSAQRSEYESVVATIRREGAQQQTQGLFQRNRIGSFFTNYAVEHVLEDVAPPKTIAEFLYSRRPERRAELGNFILRRSVNMSLEPMRPMYRKIRNSPAYEDLPRDPWHIVDDYIAADRLPDYHATIKSKLRQAA